MSNDSPAQYQTVVNAVYHTAMTTNRGLTYWWPRHDGVMVRLLSPLSNCPVGTTNHRDGAIVLRPELAAMMTVFAELKPPENYYSEIDYLSPFEVRFIASIMLSRVVDGGFCSLYAVPYAMEVRCDSIDLSDTSTVNSLMDDFIGFIRCSPFEGVHKPPLLGGFPYSHNDWAELKHERQLEIFRNIDVNDHLLIRGLGALIRATMLQAFPEFLENSAMSLYVALEASFEIVREHLCAEGNLNPTATDAGRFIGKALFGVKEEYDGYFADFWEDRVKTIHPVSAYGVFPGAGLSHDDVWGLQETLLHVYDFLVTENVPDEFKGNEQKMRGDLAKLTPHSQRDIIR
jgi:hypothetical protein